MLRALALALLVVSASAAFSLSSSTNTPGYASATTTAYSLNFVSDTVQVNQGWQFVVSFPADQFTISSVSGCSFSLDAQAVAAATCIANSTNNQIVFQNVASSAVTPSAIVVNFSTQSAVSASSPIIDTYMLDGTGTAVTDTFVQVQLTFTTATFSGCTIASSSNSTGALGVWTVTLTPFVNVKVDESIVLVLPLWSDTTPSNFQNGSANCSSSCSNTYDTSYQTITLTGAIATAEAAAFSFQLNNIKNPPSTAPISIQVSISTQVGVVQQCTNTFSVGVPNSLNSITFPNSNRSISVVNPIIFNAVTSNPLPSNAYLRVVTSLNVGYTYVPLRPNKLQKVITTDGSLLLSNLTSASVSSQYPITVGNFTLTNPKYASKNVLVTFSTEEYISGVYYKIDSSTINISADVSTIKTSSLVVANKAINQSSTYNISFTTVNALSGLATIVVVFPAEVSLAVPGSVCTSLYTSCTANATAVTIKTGVALNAGTNVTLSVSNVRNPLTATPSSPFQVYTYYSSMDEPVDQLLVGPTVQATAVPMSSVTVVPANTTVLAKQVDYSFALQLTNRIPSGSTFSITFPSEVPLDTITLKSASSACSLAQQTNQQVNLTCSFELNALNFTLSGVNNPVSTATTSTFTIQAYSNGYLQEYMLIGLTVAMDTPALINSFAVTSSNSTVSQTANYTFTLTLSTTHYTGDRAVLNIPSEITVGSGFQCSPALGLLAVACAQTSSTVIDVTLTFGTFPSDFKIGFTITGFKNNWLTDPSSIGLVTTTNQTVRYYVEKGTAQLTYTASQLVFSVLQDQNIVLLSNSTLKLTVQSQYALTKATDTTKLYLVVSLPSTSFTSYSGNCSASAGVCKDATSSNSFNITGFGQFSASMSITILANTAYFASLSDPLSVSLFYGNSLVSSQTTTASVYCQSPCQKCTATVTVCLSCLPAPYTNNNTYVSANNSCAKTCPQNSLYNTSTQNCDPCINNCASCSGTTSGCTSCVAGTFLINSTCMLACPSKYYINGSVCADCVTPCLTCTTQTTCSSCVSGYNFYLNSCLSVCTDPTTIPINGNCVPCSSSCSSCSGNITRCISCKSGLYLLNNSCVSSCIDGTFVNGTACSSCVSPCLTCSTSTVCLRCNSSMYFYSNTCLSVCPAGTYANALGSCVNCSTECLTCSGLSNNCTSCTSSMYRMNNTCVSTCTPPLYPYQGACVQCIDPCKTCTVLPSNCTSCLTGYLYNYGCVSSCPQGYYTTGNDTTCLSCASNCLSCTTAVQCLICSESTMLFNGLCLTDCPASTPIIANRTCLSCSSNCLTCAVSPENCTACPINRFLLRYTCVQTCPIGTMSDPILSVCTTATFGQVIFYFPFFITTVCMVGLAVVSRIFNSNTAVLTSVVSVGSVLELCSWFYNLWNQLNDKEEGVSNRQVALALLAAAFAVWLVLNISFYIVMTLRVKSDDYFRLWLSVSPPNYWCYMVLCHLSLVSFRLYRFLYCRLFNLLPLSMMFKNNSTIFPVTTIFVVVTLIFCEIPVIVGATLLAYHKQLKDQVFYSCVETIVLTAVVALLSLADIYKSDDFFNDSEYIRLKKYLEKSRDEQTKQQDETYLDGPILGFESENCIGSAGKANYYKSDGELLMQEDSSSTINHAYDQDDGDACFPPPRINKKHARINIFDAVLEQQAEYESDFSEDSYDKAVRKEAEKQRPRSLDGDRPRSSFLLEDGIDEPSTYRNEMSPPKKDIADDNRSLVDPKSLKKRWNDMIKERRDKARSIFKEQQIQTEEQPVFGKLYHIDEQVDPALKSHLEPYFTTKRKRRNNRMKLNYDDSMKKTAEIYLQRLEVLQDKKARARRIKQRSQRKLQQELERQEEPMVEPPPSPPASRRIREQINLDF